MVMAVENVDLGSVILKDAQHRDDTVTFAGADTFAEGTILARRSVAIAVTASAVTGTGDGTVTLATVVAGQIVPVVGAYVLTCTEGGITHGGVFNLVDPNGAQVAAGLTMTPGAGGTTVIEAAGLQFTITDGGTDFVAADFFTLTVAADGKLVPFSLTGAGGEQIPLAVLTYDVTKAGAGDEPIRAMVAGDVRKERLIIDADGDDSNVDAAVIDQLRHFGIVAINVSELNIPDNQ